jgi:hypothetical protein
MKKIIHVVVIIILVLAIIGGVVFFNKDEENKQNIVENNISDDNILQNVLSNTIDENIVIENELLNEVERENIEEIKKMQSEINSTANSNIYYVDEEYDGRKILQVRPVIQYEVDLAGILKNGKPEEGEIGDLLRNGPQKNGIWISEQSRQAFGNLLKNNYINNFYITDDGYLQANENVVGDLATKLVNMINSNKLYIINMTGTAYERDYISGEITEYPFEAMDPYQVIQSYITDDSIILEITPNKANKLSNKEILEAVVNY